MNKKEAGIGQLKGLYPLLDYSWSLSLPKAQLGCCLTIGKVTRWLDYLFNIWLFATM